MAGLKAIGEKGQLERKGASRLSVWCEASLNAFYMVETEAFVDGWFLNRCKRLLAQGMLLQRMLFFLWRIQNPSLLQFKIQGHVPFPTRPSLHPARVQDKTTWKVCFFISHKNVTCNIHPLINYKLLEYRIKKEIHPVLMRQKDLVSQSWKNSLQSLCCINIVSHIFNVESDKK